MTYAAHTRLKNCSWTPIRNLFHI